MLNNLSREILPYTVFKL